MHDEAVVGLEVTVHDRRLQAVQVHHAQGHVQGHLPPPVMAEAQRPRAVQHVVEVAMCRVLRHDTGPELAAWVPDGTQELDDVRVLELRHHRHLLVKLVVHTARLQSLDRDHGSLPVALVHHPEAALANGLQQRDVLMVLLLEAQGQLLNLLQGVPAKWGGGGRQLLSASSSQVLNASRHTRHSVMQMCAIGSAHAIAICPWRQRASGLARVPDRVAFCANLGPASQVHEDHRRQLASAVGQPTHGTACCLGGHSARLSGGHFTRLPVTRDGDKSSGVGLAAVHEGAVIAALAR
mmetsp:Transcript_2893/g.6330  ORF Transcript_2893/g.6330 Transcript_2893/m.6330 type:complete len:294 (-) Transcript_2893:1507-2388(-)